MRDALDKQLPDLTGYSLTAIEEQATDVSCLVFHALTSEKLQILYLFLHRPRTRIANFVCNSGFPPMESATLQKDDQAGVLLLSIKFLPGQLEIAFRDFTTQAASEPIERL